jgi:hypothetical protein
VLVLVGEKHSPLWVCSLTLWKENETGSIKSSLQFRSGTYDKKFEASRDAASLALASRAQPLSLENTADAVVQLDRIVQAFGQVR